MVEAALVSSAFLLGAALVILHMLREDSRQRRDAKLELDKSAKELQSVLTAMNELHNRSAKAVLDLQDKVQSHGMIIGGLSSGIRK